MAAYGKRRFVHRSSLESGANNGIEQSSSSANYQFRFHVSEANNSTNANVSDSGSIQNDENEHEQQHVQVPLSGNELKQLFDRASSNIMVEPTDNKEFFKRDASIKAPKTGEIINIPFPPESSPRPEDMEIDTEELLKSAKQNAGPLFIEKFTPNKKEINVPVSIISISFSQPMVAIGSLGEQLLNEELGISLTPKADGQWKWIGTKMIQFEAKHRLPYSTNYRLNIDKERCVSVFGGKFIGNIEHSNITIFTSIA